MHSDELLLQVKQSFVQSDSCRRRVILRSWNLCLNRWTASPPGARKPAHAKRPRIGQRITIGAVGRCCGLGGPAIRLPKRQHTADWKVVATRRLRNLGDFMFLPSDEL